jgi:membrane protein YqaA with SNARE-associated domain
MNLMPWENIDKLYERVVKSNFMTSCVNSVATVLITIGVPANRTPDADDLMISTAATIGTLAGYWYWLGRSHARRRIELQNDLNKVQTNFYHHVGIYVICFNIGSANCQRA